MQTLLNLTRKKKFALMLVLFLVAAGLWGAGRILMLGARANILTGKFDDDDKPDTIELKFDGKVATIRIDSTQTKDQIDIPVSKSEGGICEGELYLLPEDPSPYSEKPSAQEKKALTRVSQLAKNGMLGFALKNGNCEPFHFYFDPDSRTFAIWRL